jgi:hypothetical protein
MTEPTKQRPGDQALPDPGGAGICVQDLIIAEMEQSKRVGQQRYGQTLRTFNGRRGIQDALEEARDFYVYLTQLNAESQAGRDQLVHVIATALASQAATKFGTARIQDLIERYRPVAEIAVDRIMGWIVGHPTLTGSACQVKECYQSPAAFIHTPDGWTSMCVGHARGYYMSGVS